MPFFFLRLFCFLLVGWSTAAFAEYPNLCDKGDTPLFRCDLIETKKSVSVCEKYTNGNVVDGIRSWSYRYGTSDHLDIDLGYGPGRVRNQVFTDKQTNKEPIEIDYYYRFAHGDYSYVTFRTKETGVYDRKGIAVFHNGKLANTLTCDLETFDDRGSSIETMKSTFKPGLDLSSAYLYWSQILPPESAVIKQKPFGAKKYRFDAAY